MHDHRYFYSKHIFKTARGTLNEQCSNWWRSLTIKHYQQMILFSQSSVGFISANSQHQLQPWIHAVRLVTAGCSGSLTACQLEPAWDPQQAWSDWRIPQALCRARLCHVLQQKGHCWLPRNIKFTNRSSIVSQSPGLGCWFCLARALFFQMFSEDARREGNPLVRGM